MNIEIFTSICEAKAIRDSEFTLGRKEGINLNPSKRTSMKKALSSLLVTVSSFLF